MKYSDRWVTDSDKSSGYMLNFCPRFSKERKRNGIFWKTTSLFVVIVFFFPNSPHWVRISWPDPVEISFKWAQLSVSSRRAILSRIKMFYSLRYMPDQKPIVLEILWQLKGFPRDCNWMAGGSWDFSWSCVNNYTIFKYIFVWVDRTMEIMMQLNLLSSPNDSTVLQLSKVQCVAETTDERLQRM